MTLQSIFESDDRGAVLIYVAIALLAVTAVSMLVIDFGVFWVSRRQAQNSADAAAHAGALALAFEPAGSRVNSATQAALAVAQRNKVWGEAPSVTSVGDITFPNPCWFNKADVTEMCVRVAVYRDSGHQNPLPTFFGRLAEVTDQGIQATATAEVMPGNTTRCMKPWAIPDIGFLVDDKLGTQRLLIPPPNPNQQLVFRAVALKCSGNPCYQAAIPACVNTPVSIGDTLGYASGGAANTVDLPSHKQGVNDLMALDPNATFNTVTKKVEHSCVGNAGVPWTCGVNVPPGLVESPRVVSIPAYDVSQPGTTVVKNILGVFVAGMNASSGIITVNFITKTGELDLTRTKVSLASAFTRTVLFVR
jgi:hypothetical protein